MTNMVWLVTSGEYSDYGVDGVFSTEAKAKEYMAWRRGPDDPDAGRFTYDEFRIEEYVLDAPVGETGAFTVYASVEQALRGDWSKYVCSWEPKEGNSPARATLSYSGEVFIHGAGKTIAHARRSVIELARAIKAGTYIVQS